MYTRFTLYAVYIYIYFAFPAKGAPPLPQSFPVNQTLVISYPLKMGLNPLCFMMPKLPFLVAYHHPRCILALTLFIHGEVIPGTQSALQ